MKTHNLRIATLSLAVGVSALSTLPAQAHINMTGALTSRGGDQKLSPCDGKRGDGPVYTFEPGATITLALDENIPHPSYFRIAFDNDGQDGFKEPASIDPIEKTRACPFDPNDQCGTSDFCNVVSTDGATVLWDNLDPHSAMFGSKWSWNVKLPDVECDNCTIQVIQVMEDTIHGAYCPQGEPCAEKDDSLEDIYHRCIDIKLVKGTKGGDGTTTDAIANKGMECKAGATPSEPEVLADGGVAEPGENTPPRRDAAVGTGHDGPSDSSDDDDGETASSGGKADAGKPTVKKDAGTSSADEEPASGGDDGCSVAFGAGHGVNGAGLSLLALAAGLLARRRKAARRDAA